MGTPFSKGSLLLNEYQVGDMLEADEVFYWLTAVNTTSGADVVLQILRNGVADNREGEIYDYFDKLQGLNRKGIDIPDFVMQDEEIPFAAVYPAKKRMSLLDYLKQEPETAALLWKQASEMLHSLHNQKIAHGLVSADCFFVADGQLQLGKFGYGLVLSLNNGMSKASFAKKNGTRV